MPDATVASTGFNVTYEADCANMVGLEQGTRISMWNPLGPAYNPGDRLSVLLCWQNSVRACVCEPKDREVVFSVNGMRCRARYSASTLCAYAPELSAPAAVHALLDERDCESDAESRS